MRWGIWRCQETGLDYLEWESKLKFDDQWMDKADPKYGTPTPQALAAMELKRLYDWWKNIRPNRQDPYGESGWNEFYERRRIAHAGGDDDMLFEDKTDEDHAESKRLLDAIDAIEKRNDDEDEVMMMALIRIRQHLWT